MLAKKLFPSDPEKTRSRYFIVGIAAAVVPFFLGICFHKTGVATVGVPSPVGAFLVFTVLCLVLTFIIIWSFSRAIPSKTRKGAHLAR